MKIFTSIGKTSDIVSIYIILLLFDNIIPLNNDTVVGMHDISSSF